MPRLLHTSDVHVGEWAHVAPDRVEPLDAMRGVVDLAIREQVDLVVFAGDTFDSNRVAQAICDLVVELLDRLPMPSVILPGNHDPYDDACVWRRMDLPSRVTLIRERDGESHRFGDIGIWGRPHLSYAEDLQPLRDVPAPDGAAWQVGLAHGHLVRRPDDLLRSYLIRADEIAASGKDYIALGHWDVHHDVSQGDVTAVYSGSPNRRGVAALVDLDQTNGSRTVRVTRVQF